MRPGRAADPSPPSSAKVLEEYSYTSTPFWATTGPVTGLLYLLNIHTMFFYFCVNPFPSLLANTANCRCSPYRCVCDNTSDNIFVCLLYPVYIHDVC